jgi:hypothetical protein
MLGRHKQLLLIAAILLIPILLGMTPLNMGYRLANGGPFTPCKQAQWSNYCPFHSIASYENPIIVNLNSTQVTQESTPALNIEIFDLDFMQSNFTLNSVPLRC